MARGLGLWGLGLFLLAIPVLAQQVTLDIQPRVLRLNETATLKLAFINLNPTHAPTLPDMPGFDISFIGQEQHFQIVNGNQERRLTYNFQMQPRATGQFQLGPFALNLTGQTIEFEAVTIEVLPPAGSGGNTGNPAEELVFARIVLPRTEVFLQERFDVELSLFHRGINLDRGIQLLNLPSTGLHLEDFQEIGSAREMFNNELYEVRRFRMRGTALTAGTFQLAPMVRVNVLVRRERSRDPFFGGFDDVFFGRHEAQPLTVPAEPMNVIIRPLPQDNRPDQFGGAVGQFDMNLEIQPREVTAGDPITLTTRITGRGNFENISMPAIELGDDFRSYDPKLIEASRDHKVFEQVVIPRRDTIREIPAVSFTYFDPERAEYQTIARGPYPLLVKAGSSESPHFVQTPSTLPAPDRAPLGIDIVDLKRTPENVHPVNIQRATRISLPLHLIPALALMSLFVFQRHRETQNRDVTRRRRSMAPRSARVALRAAEAALGRNDTGAFYQALWQALADYVAHRCNLEAGEVSPGLILQRVRNGGMSPDHIEALQTLIQECDEARFTRVAGAIEPERLKTQLQKTQELLRACEKIQLS